LIEGRQARADYSPPLERNYSRFAFCRSFFRDLLSLLAGLRKADGYRLLAAFDLSALAAMAAFCGTLFVAAHSFLTSLPELSEYLRFLAVFFAMDLFLLLVNSGRYTGFPAS
jgi:hypothetical protein